MKDFLKHQLAAFLVDRVTKQGIFRWLTDKQAIIIDYFFTFGKLPNLRHPETISEKLQWVKLYGGLEKHSKYVDKYEVRNFINKTIGEKYAVPLLGVWDKFEDINFNKLPKQFVLKTTHGSSYVFVCKDKSSLDKKRLGKTVAKWMEENFYKKTREIQYKSCKPRIICEKYLEDESGGLTDYQFFCFNGKPYLIEVISDRFLEMKGDYFDLNWKILPIHYRGEPHSKKTLKKPKNFTEMLAVSEKLSKLFPFVRVDLYSIKNKIYFGELTFTPDNGLLVFYPSQVNYQLGKLINLSKYDN